MCKLIKFAYLMLWRDLLPIQPDRNVCNPCHGKGKFGRDECSVCGGSGASE